MAATEELSILEFIKELMQDGPLRAWFQDNPEAALEHYGLDDLSAGDVQDALVLIDDGEITDFSRDYDSRPSFDFGAANWGSSHRDGDGDDHHEAVAQLSRFVTNNFVRDGDTLVDNSTNQRIDTDGGDFEQDIDVDQTLASGDGAVAAGGDIDDSTITSGNGNQVGDGNVRGDGNVVGDDNAVVSGNGNTTAFGGGANSTDVGGDLEIGDGSGFSGGGGGVFVDNTDNSINDSLNDDSDNSINDSGNADIDASTNDSGNTTTEIDVDDSLNDNSDNSLNNVGNTDVDL